jgi:hypothetical protein
MEVSLRSIGKSMQTLGYRDMSSGRLACGSAVLTLPLGHHLSADRRYLSAMIARVSSSRSFGVA